MKTCIAVVCVVVLTLLLSSCSFLFLTFALGVSYNVHVELTVADLSPELTWDATSADTLEYAWAVEVDTDGDQTTGSPSGTEVLVRLVHFSSGSLSSQGTLPESAARSSRSPTEEYAFTLSRDRWNDTSAGWEDDTDDWTCNISGNTIGISFFVVDLLPGAEFHALFSTQYYPPSGPLVTDTAETGIVTGGVTTTDATGDAGGYSFIDIISGAITLN